VRRLLCGHSSLKRFLSLSLVAMFFFLGEALVISSSAAFIIGLCREKCFGAFMGMAHITYDVGHASGPIPPASS